MVYGKRLTVSCPKACFDRKASEGENVTQKPWIILSAAGAACMAAVIGASLLAGGCDKLIECASGSFPMRCHWAYIACALLGAAGLAPSACSLFARGKEARRLLAACTLVIDAAVAICLSPYGIGICPSGMQCQETAPIVWGICACCAVICLAQIFKADPERAQLPKLEL